jgi:hypothetical protein
MRGLCLTALASLNITQKWAIKGGMPSCGRHRDGQDSISKEQVCVRLTIIYTIDLRKNQGGVEKNFQTLKKRGGTR